MLGLAWSLRMEVLREQEAEADLNASFTKVLAADRKALEELDDAAVAEEDLDRLQAAQEMKELQEMRARLGLDSGDTGVDLASK